MYHVICLHFYWKNVPLTGSRRLATFRQKLPCSDVIQLAITQFFLDKIGQNFNRWCKIDVEEAISSFTSIAPFSSSYRECSTGGAFFDPPPLSQWRVNVRHSIRDQPPPLRPCRHVHDSDLRLGKPLGASLAPQRVGSSKISHGWRWRERLTPAFRNQYRKVVQQSE